MDLVKITKRTVSKFFFYEKHPSLIIRLNNHQRGTRPSIINTSICSHILLEPFRRETPYNALLRHITYYDRLCTANYI